jgi:hypothetical protein
MLMRIGFAVKGRFKVNKKSEDEKRIENEVGAEEEQEETGRLNEATGIRIWELMRMSE